MAGPKADPVRKSTEKFCFCFVCYLNCQHAAEQQQTLAEQLLRPGGSTILQLRLLTLQVRAPEDLGEQSPLCGPGQCSLKHRLTFQWQVVSELSVLTHHRGHLRVGRHRRCHLRAKSLAVSEP